MASASTGVVRLAIGSVELDAHLWARDARRTPNRHASPLVAAPAWTSLCAWVLQLSARWLVARRR
jgi:hypothetical protein